MDLARGLSAGLLALSLAAAGCYGPFNLTRRLYHSSPRRCHGAGW